MGQYYHGLIVQPDCHRCPLQRERKVLPDGPVPSKLVFVGDEPGHTEVDEGRGFVGPSGRLLWFLAGKQGIVREQHVWVTNAKLCRVRKVRLSTGAELSEAEVNAYATACCHRRLVGELYVVTRNDPNAVIMPLGNIALSTTSKRRGARVFPYRGSIMPADLERLWTEAQIIAGAL